MTTSPTLSPLTTAPSTLWWVAAITIRFFRGVATFVLAAALLRTMVNPAATHEWTLTGPFLLMVILWWAGRRASIHAAAHVPGMFSRHRLPLNSAYLTSDAAHLVLNLAGTWWLSQQADLQPYAGVFLMASGFGMLLWNLTNLLPGITITGPVDAVRMILSVLTPIAYVVIAQLHVDYSWTVALALALAVTLPARLTLSLIRGRRRGTTAVLAPAAVAAATPTPTVADSPPAVAAPATGTPSGNMKYLTRASLLAAAASAGLLAAGLVARWVAVSDPEFPIAVPASVAVSLAAATLAGSAVRLGRTMATSSPQPGGWVPWLTAVVLAGATIAVILPALSSMPELGLLSLFTGAVFGVGIEASTRPTPGGR